MVFSSFIHTFGNAFITKSQAFSGTQTIDRSSSISFTHCFAVTILSREGRNIMDFPGGCWSASSTKATT